MDNEWNKYDAYDLFSTVVGVLLIPVGLLWRTFKLLKQLATDT